MSAFFETKIEFLKGIGPQKAALLNKELEIFTYGQLLQYYPFRYEDRTQMYAIKQVTEMHGNVQVKGTIYYMELIGEGPKKRLVAYLKDATGEIELIWFRSIAWVQKNIKKGTEYLVYGKPTWYHGTWNIAHPEIEPFVPEQNYSGKLQAVYNSTEKLRNYGLDSKGISRIVQQLIPLALPYIKETLPTYIVKEMNLAERAFALEKIHLATTQEDLDKAIFRLKFEELFYTQLKILQTKQINKQKNAGYIFKQIPLVNDFYKHHMPFELTNAQKRVIREIYEDLKSGKQMNRLLQGDVGSGKTIVAFIVMLMAIDHQMQACMMAPTEILATQHYNSLKPFADTLGIHIGMLMGSTKKSERTILHEKLRSGEMQILVGTHALLEDTVQFKQLGVCIIDEQHRFGVAQRARLWNKNNNIPPHILVMTATPIPRTLAMTFYGDLDVSAIDELPAGRKPIKTVHRYESQRLAVFGFLKEEISKGRQVYIVYPLIEESEKLDLADLFNGYESICRDFPKPQYQVSIMHGRMSAKEKDFEIQRFIRNETQIMVATTVIEVGVNVPNASVMVVENAERFGLAQLHQLRGRVGRGAEQSYCILMTGNKVTNESKEKLSVLVQTNNGFEIAEADLKLRGPGDLMGTKQSGVLDLLLANLAHDQPILHDARRWAQLIIDNDPQLQLPENQPIAQHIQSLKTSIVNWSRIS